ncbi:MAG: hypothetical protein ACYS18_11700 [Planctomycetota bacterium]|jgi:amidophosphoribosyltransferase
MISEKKENCGLFAIFGDTDAVRKTYLGLYSLQHRAQESAGIASSNGEFIQCYAGMGTVGRVFRRANQSQTYQSPPNLRSGIRTSVADQ